MTTNSEAGVAVPEIERAGQDQGPARSKIGPPALSYIIATAPRTGSTLLAQALVSTGLAGRPNEFFDIHDHNERFWVETLKIASDAEYFDKALTAGTGANGVFGFKLLWHQSPALIKKLRASQALADAPPENSFHQLLTRRLGAPPRYIWLRRRDKVAQAISYFRASKTGLWRSTDDLAGGRQADAELAFDFDLIAQYVRTVQDFDLRWEAFFRAHRLKVLMVVYENFIDSYAATVSSIFDFLGLPRDGVKLTPPRLRRQADERSIEWQNRFIEMATDRGLITPARAQSARSRKPDGEGRVDPTADAAPRDRPPRRKKAAAIPAEPPLPLHAYQLSPLYGPGRLVRAPAEREWMDATPVRFAYRCLPMLIANQHGWLILNKDKIAVTWNGGPDPASLKIDFLSGEQPRDAVSLFGSGVLTFTIGYLFRTPPGYNLYVRGPANWPKDGITALEGVVESDWTEATFTMNWKVTRPNHPLVFEAGEPIAMVSPVKRGEVERFRPELHWLSEEPELAELHREWAQSRAKHNADLKIPNSQAQKDGWQRHYVRGVSIRKEPAREHQTKLNLSELIDKRK